MENPITPKINRMSPLLLVTDIEKTISFYTQYLGFKVDFRYEDFYAGIVNGAISIHLKLSYSGKAERAEKIKNQDLDLIFSVDNIQELYEAIKKTSVNILQPLREMPYGTEFYITDPDDYLISFLNVPEEYR